MRELLTLQKVKQISLEKGFIFLNKEYGGCKLRYNFKCLKDNEIHKTTFDNIHRGKGLRCCGIRKLKIIWEKQKLPIES